MPNKGSLLGVSYLGNDTDFKAIQKAGATGLIKGEGIPYKWANQTWFYPEREVSQYELMQGLRNYFPALNNNWDASGESLNLSGMRAMLNFVNKDVFDESNEEGITFGLNQVIKGWQEGMQYFKEGGNGKLFIPSALGYGKNPPPGIPKNAVLIFDVSLKQVF